jgi:hypothetical protein
MFALVFFVRSLFSPDLETRRDIIKVRVGVALALFVLDPAVLPMPT